MSSIKILSIKTKKLKKNIIDKICFLKSQHYKYNYNQQKMWFKKNIKDSYIHNIIMFKQKIIGYNCLRDLYIKKKLVFYLFDTIIIDKDFRKYGYSKLLMNKSNQIIKKKRVFGFLMCNKNMENFYKNFKWKVLKKKNVIKSKKKIYMTYLFKNKTDYKVGNVYSVIEKINNDL
tara:strand:+ start:20831 stop:21352 length:522 start_codon:yes stop_codon:yes gene_type:complete